MITLPSIAVITVVRNAASTILRCLESTRVSGVKNIIIDGGSNDGTVDILRSQSSRWHWWCSEPDNGISSAFNKGLRHTNAEVIGLLNADDWYEPGAIELVRHCFALRETEVVHGRVRYWSDGRKIRIAEGDHQALRRSGSVNHPSVFVRREVYNRLGGFDESFRYAMDYDILLRWLTNGVHFTYLPRVLANMSLGGVSDRRRFAGLREVRVSQRRYLDPVQAEMNHTCLMARARIRSFLEHSGLHGIVASQRTRSRGMRTVEH